MVEEPVRVLVEARAADGAHLAREARGDRRRAVDVPRREAVALHRPLAEDLDVRRRRDVAARVVLGVDVREERQADVAGLQGEGDDAVGVRLAQRFPHGPGLRGVDDAAAHQVVPGRGVGPPERALDVARPRVGVRVAARLLADAGRAVAAVGAVDVDFRAALHGADLGAVQARADVAAVARVGHRDVAAAELLDAGRARERLALEEAVGQLLALAAVAVAGVVALAAHVDAALGLVDAGEGRRGRRRPARVAVPDLAGRARVELAGRRVDLALVVRGAAAREHLAVQRRAAALHLAVRAVLGAGAALAARRRRLSLGQLRGAVVVGHGIALARAEGQQGGEQSRQDQGILRHGCALLPLGGGPTRAKAREVAIPCTLCVQKLGTRNSIGTDRPKAAVAQYSDHPGTPEDNQRTEAVRQ